MLFNRDSFKQRCTVFINRSGEPAIVVAQHYNGPRGFLVEDESPIVLPEVDPPEALGTAVLAALRATSIRAARNYRNRKLTDWPAFRASGARSVRAFEQDFIRLHISGASSANIIYGIEGWPNKNARLRVTREVSTGSPAAMGEACIDVWRACRDRAV